MRRGRGYGHPMLLIRAAGVDDEAFIVAMARQASVIEDRPLPAADAAAVRAVLPHDLKAVVIAENPEAARRGAAWWHWHDPPLARDTSGRPQLPELIVATCAEERDHGIGSSLIEALTLRAAEHFSAIVLNVHIRNPAARLYSRAGFTVLGKGRGPLGVAMRRDLSTS
jgi:GNAT superfamily N-acetyltransferase